MSWMNVKKLHPNAQLPHRAHSTDAGLDVFAIKNGCVQAGKDAIIETGISLSIPDGWVAVVKEKSGKATKNKITVGACVIDSGYRGELLIHLFNNDPVLPFTYGIGEKIAQLVVVPCWTGQPEWVRELEESDRGEGRFGSTGDKIGLSLPDDPEYFHRKSMEREMSGKMKSEIVVIVDRSGSMGAILEDAVGGLRQFVKEQKKIEGEATFTLAQFDSAYELVYDNVDLREIDPEKIPFQPRGMTALYDAIGRTINTVASRHSCPTCAKKTKTIFAILTDGMENASREFNMHKINDMITQQREEHEWEFIFLAANQDAFETGGQLGIKASDTFNFAATGEGVRTAYDSMSVATMCYRVDNSTSADDDED